ncbi:MAG: right-handed parallel beta-helix repeat-containing protein, partial [Candidatus Brocadiae bacterium]|nr:right-handed parallel beta-helix repeat-containing protein [Candidatus Brocadiia bacterium]
FADNNYVHHCAQLWVTYRNGIAIRGVGNRIAHNLIHDMPHAGVTLGGNDNVMEFNIVHHCNLQSADTGGIYFCSRDWTQRGNVIRYNLFHHIGGFGKANSWAPVRGGKVPFEYPHFTWGIYLDDPTTGTHVHGNILYAVPMCGLHNHGGRDNLWENNVIVDCPAFQAGRLSPSWSEWPPIYERLKENRREGSPYLAKYPEIAKIADTRPEAMTGVRFQRNIVYYTKAGTAWLRGQRGKSWGGDDSQLLYTLRIDKQDFDPTAFDHNCIFVEPGLDLRVSFHPIPDASGTLTWDEWRKTGADAHSILADPLFVDPANHDYRLRLSSPALELGFEPIPVELIGPHRDRFRTVAPVREAPGVSALGDFTTERAYAPPRFRPVEAREIALRDGLGNVFAKAAAKKPIKVAYFGGGIHSANTGWRRTVIDWLRKHCGKVEEIDAGVTDACRGIGFSVYRFRREVLGHKPDLVLVDFAPVPSEANADSIQRSAEAIVRQAWSADPTIDFLFLHAFVAGYEDAYAEGVHPTAVSAYERIADHYGIPSVSMAFRAAKLIREGKALAKGTPDEAKKAGKQLITTTGRTPTSEAHLLYAAAVVAALRQAAASPKATAHKLPAPYRPDHYERARLVPITKAMLSGKWEALPADHELSKRLRSHMAPIWFTNTPGAKLTFRFKGTAASILDLMGPDTGRVNVTVDGEPAGTRQQVDPWAYYQRLSALPLASGLPDGEHTITLELLPEPPSRAAPIASAKKAGRFDPKLFEGVALRLGGLRLLGEIVE